MKVVNLFVQNIKRISAADVTPTGATVCVGGRNGQGKSSLLDSIMFALAGKWSLPSKPVKKGEERGRIEVNLGDLKVTRTVTEDRGGSLKVTDAEGRDVSSPQALLDRLYNQHTFDPLSFIHMPPREQVVALRKLTGFDVTDLDTEEEKIKANLGRLTHVAQQCKSRIDPISFPPGTPDEEINLDEFGALLQEAERQKKIIADERASVDRMRHELQEMERRVASIGTDILHRQKQIEELTQTKLDIQAAITKGRSLMTRIEEGIRPEPVTQTLLAQYQNAIHVNQAVKQKQAVISLLAEKDVVDAQIEQNRKRQAEIKNERWARIAALKMPVDGLTIEENEVQFNGVPLSSCSSAEQLRVSVAMGLSMNPDLRVLLIRDGSLLDDDSLALIETMARERDAQIWIERVGEGEECQVIIEDGMVRGAVVDDT